MCTPRVGTPRVGTPCGGTQCGGSITPSGCGTEPFQDLLVFLELDLLDAPLDAPCDCGAAASESRGATPSERRGVWLRAAAVWLRAAAVCDRLGGPFDPRARRGGRRPHRPGQRPHITLPFGGCVARRSRRRETGAPLRRRARCHVPRQMHLELSRVLCRLCESRALLDDPLPVKRKNAMMRYGEKGCATYGRNGVSGWRDQITSPSPL